MQEAELPTAVAAGAAEEEEEEEEEELGTAEARAGGMLLAAHVAAARVAQGDDDDDDDDDGRGRRRRRAGVAGRSNSQEWYAAAASDIAQAECGGPPDSLDDYMSYYSQDADARADATLGALVLRQEEEEAIAVAAGADGAFGIPAHVRIPHHLRHHRHVHKPSLSHLLDATAASKARAAALVEEFSRGASIHL